MSEWILERLVPSSRELFRSLVAALATAPERSYVFAELLDLLEPMSAEAFEAAVAELPPVELDAYWQNQLAATVEHAAARKHAKLPSWTRDIPPLDEPVFGSSLRSLRLYLLVHALPAFAARNIFITANVGDRV